MQWSKNDNISLCEVVCEIVQHKEISSEFYLSTVLEKMICYFPSVVIIALFIMCYKYMIFINICITSKKISWYWVMYHFGVGCFRCCLCHPIPVVTLILICRWHHHVSNGFQWGTKYSHALSKHINTTILHR